MKNTEFLYIDKLIFYHISSKVIEKNKEKLILFDLPKNAKIK